MQDIFYSLDRCHFCHEKLSPNYIGFANMTDYWCENKKCKYQYIVFYDNAVSMYYKIHFIIKNKYEIYINLDSNSTRIGFDKSLYNISEILKVSNTLTEEENFKKIKNIMVLL